MRKLNDMGILCRKTIWISKYNTILNQVSQKLTCEFPEAKNLRVRATLSAAEISGLMELECPLRERIGATCKGSILYKCIKCTNDLQ